MTSLSSPPVSPQSFSQKLIEENKKLKEENAQLKKLHSDKDKYLERAGLSLPNELNIFLDPKKLPVGGSNIEPIWESRRTLSKEFVPLAASEFGGRISRVLDEIMRTERDYNTDLSQLLKNYYGPLKKQSWLSQKDLSHLFHNLDEVAHASHSLWVSLEKAAKENEGLTPVAFAKAVIQASIRLEKYGKFCAGYHQWITLGGLLSKIKSSKEFRQFEEQTMDGIPDQKYKQPLESYLIKPVQRLTKYPLFFFELLREMKKDGGYSKEDIEIVQQGERAISNVVEKANSEAKNMEIELRYEQFVQNLEGELGNATPLVSFSTYVTQVTGTITESSTKKVRKGIQAVLILFNTALIITKKRGNKLKFKHFIVFSDIRVTDIRIEGNHDNSGICIQNRKLNEENFDILITTKEKLDFLSDFQRIQKEHYFLARRNSRSDSDSHDDPLGSSLPAPIIGISQSNPSSPSLQPLKNSPSLKLSNSLPNSPHTQELNNAVQKRQPPKKTVSLSGINNLPPPKFNSNHNDLPLPILNSSVNSKSLDDVTLPASSNKRILSKKKSASDIKKSPPKFG